MALQTFSAGDLSFEFDADLGMLRYLSFGDLELIRGVYVAVRNEHWGTYPHQVEVTRIVPGELAWTDRSGPTDITGILTWNESVLSFTVSVLARDAFHTQRTGLCLLHPASARGATCRITHSDGTFEEGQLPGHISPHQPFFDIAAIRHEVEGILVDVAFTGEVFEMEDQRNWTDASFKTYCRPLDWARPYAVEQGEVIVHSARIFVEGGAPCQRMGGPVVISIGDEVAPLPALGAVYPGADLSGLPLSHVLVEASVEDEDRIDAAAEAAEGRELEVLVTGSPEASAVEELERHRMIRRFLVPDAALRQELAGWALRAEVVPATTGNFTEMNRERPEASAPALAFTTNAQVHAFDDLSIVETLEGLAHVVESARAIAGDRPVRVGPIRLGAPDDPRVTGPFATPWTLAALQRVAENGAAAATFAHAAPLAALAGVPGPVRRVESSDPLRAYALAVGDRVWLLNLTGDDQAVEFRGERFVLGAYEVRAV